MSATQIYLDSVIMGEIEKFSWLISGVTTTPTFFARENVDYHEFLEEFRAKFPSLELHIEALGDSARTTKQEAEKIISAPWFDNKKVVLKIPVTLENMKLVNDFSGKGIKFNTHLVFTPTQAFLAAHSGAAYICPLLGRYAESIKSTTSDGAVETDHAQSLIENIMTILHHANLRPPVKVMASSLRTKDNMLAALNAGVDAITVPSSILDESFDHPLTVAGIKKFLEDISTQKGD